MFSKIDKPENKDLLDPSTCVLEAANQALLLRNDGLCSDLIDAVFSYFSHETDGEMLLDDRPSLHSPEITRAVAMGSRTASLLATLFGRSTDMRRWDALINALDVAIYSTDAAGRLTHYNPAAVGFWGWQPLLQRQQYCGSWRLFEPDGTFLAHEQCPMAICLREQRAVRGSWNVAHQPDGTPMPFAAFPTPVFDQSGQLSGGFNVLVDLSHAEALVSRRAA